MRPVLLRLEGLVIPSYGALECAGWLAAALWLLAHRDEAKATWAEFWSLGYLIIFSALLGAKLGFFAVSGRDFLADPWEYIRTWRIGWVYWTGFAAPILAGFAYQAVYNRLYRPRRYLPIADYFATAVPLGHFFGRLGCFLEGCCHGRPTGLPWGVRFDNPASSVSLELLGRKLHPTQLYEAAAELAIFLFLARWVMPRIREGRFRYGIALFAYAGLYSMLRFSVEFLRGDDRGVFLWPVLSPSQWWSLLGLVLTAFFLRRRGVIERDPKEHSLYL